MGLLGYKEKDYNKNTAIFSNLLSQLAKEIDWVDVGFLIDTAVDKLKDIKYTKGDGKVQKAIDERILSIIEAMQNDYQQGSQSRCYSDGERLLSAIIEARKFGKEKFTPAQLGAQKVMAECKARLKDQMQKKAAIQKKLDELSRKAEKLDPESAAYQDIDMEYSELEADLENVDRYINELNDQRDKLKDDYSLFENEEFADTLKELEIMSDEDARKRRRKLAEEHAKRQERKIGNKEERDEFRREMNGSEGTAKKSGLSGRIAANKAKAAYDQIQGASVDATAGSSESGSNGSDSRPGRS